MDMWIAASSMQQAATSPHVYLDVVRSWKHRRELCASNQAQNPLVRKLNHDQLPFLIGICTDFPRRGTITYESTGKWVALCRPKTAPTVTKPSLRLCASVTLIPCNTCRVSPVFIEKYIGLLPSVRVGYYQRLQFGAHWDGWSPHSILHTGWAAVDGMSVTVEMREAASLTFLRHIIFRAQHSSLGVSWQTDIRIEAGGFPPC